ncbi:MAG: putative rane protein [Herminiimonas sp.]|nr:putative rane protein [Herminiimonas sp.]MDB5854617.1 putative rane protein [Herminiimonas sp.]
MQTEISRTTQPQSMPGLRSSTFMSADEAQAARRARGTRPGQPLVVPMARALGWFSIGMGVTQLLLPRALARATGMRNHPQLMRAIGIREIASGAGILVRNKPGWIWTRVAGDVMDLALLGMAATERGQRRGQRRNRLAITAAAVAGVAAVDIIASVQQARFQRSRANSGSGAVNFEKSVTVNRSPDECYRFWRDFSNLPRFMEHVESIDVKSDRLSHWVAKGPAGSTVEWDAEITADQPGQLLAWHSTEDADVLNAGTVRFEPGPGGRGTVIRVDFHYTPPGGKPGAMVAKLFGEEPEMQIDDDLRHFRQLLETGEITTTVGQSSGPRSMVARLLRKGAPG